MSCSEWKSVKLEEVVDILGDGLHGTPKYSDDGEYYFINGNNLDGKIIVNEKTKRVGLEQYLKYKKDLNDRTLLVSINGTLGKVAEYGGENIILGKSACYFNVKKDVNKKYIKYILLSDIFKHYIHNYSTGTTIKNLGLKQMREFKIPLPNIEEQEKIANILSSLDDKIELNNEMNKTLEEMAQSIFKRWFVDFEFPNEDGEPYKSSGGDMVESELGMIPKGWEVRNFRHYTENVLGGDWGKDSEQGNYSKKVYCLRGADIPEVRIGNKGALPTRYILEKNYKNKKLSTGNIVVEISGGSPTQSTGRTTYINDLMLNKFDADLVCTNFCRAITLRSKTYMEYFYFYWKFLYDNDVFFQYENGTTGIKNLDINSFLDKYKIVIPSEKIISLFSKKIAALINKIQFNGEENINISDLRDVLLPKLLSGEIEIK